MTKYLPRDGFAKLPACFSLLFIYCVLLASDHELCANYSTCFGPGGGGGGVEGITPYIGLPAIWI